MTILNGPAIKDHRCDSQDETFVVALWLSWKQDPLHHLDQPLIIIGILDDLSRGFDVMLITLNKTFQTKNRFYLAITNRTFTH